jgi:hypothetical protein
MVERNFLAGMFKLPSASFLTLVMIALGLAIEMQGLSGTIPDLSGFLPTVFG